MTQEEKDLLLKDLSARLPYHVKVKIWLKDGTTEEGPLDLEYNYADVLLDAFYYNNIKNIKPYLRPLSSMIKGEKEEMHNLLSPKGTAIYENDGIALPVNHYGEFVPYEFMNHIIQYLLKNHFDFMGLIPKGLAIEALEGMYNIKEK